jgi:hypothetical protein
MTENEILPPADEGRLDRRVGRPVEKQRIVMSQTLLTTGWPGPKGRCDMCRVNAATHWFGDTSVALCDDARCAERNAANWQRTLDEVAEHEKTPNV